MSSELLIKSNPKGLKKEVSEYFYKVKRQGHSCLKLDGGIHWKNHDAKIC